MSSSTVELFEKIKNAVAEDPGICTSYKASDIAECIYYEVVYVKQDLEEPQILKLYEVIDQKEKELSKALSEKDVVKVTVCLDSMLEILKKLPPRSEVEQRNFDEAYERHRLEGTVVVLGDSHVNFFSGNEHLTFLPVGEEINVCPQVNDLPFTALHLGSCLAYNSNLYGSTERYLEKLKWVMKNFLVSGDKVVVSLGEIDLRCHVFKQTEKQGCSYEQIVDGIIDNYFDMLLYLKENGYDVYIWGPIASESENCPRGEYLPWVGSERDRNRATAYFTDRAREKCKEIGIGFASVFDKLVDSDMRTIESFISDDMCHLSQSSFNIAFEEWIRSGILE